MSTSSRVRAAGPADAEAIADMNRRMARETEDLELDPERLLSGVRAVFDDEARGHYFVAEAEGAVVGCLMVTLEWSDWRNGVFWWIQSVYVPPEHRGTGVFRALYDHVLRAARGTTGCCGVRLYVERENERARKVYDAVGMAETPYRMYEVDFVLREDA